MRSVLVSRIGGAAMAVMAVLALAVVPARFAAADTPRVCRDRSVAGTVEESRLGRPLGGNPVPVPRQILARSGFEDLVAGFERSLCAARTRPGARRAVDAFGRGLWEVAAARAQHARLGAADLPGDDDRPLYLARLSMTLALRQWTPPFALPPPARADLEKRLEYASRGITSARFRPAPGVRRLLVSGFDPFLLDAEIRRGNPSGAAVLRLDGRTLRVGGTRVQVQAVVFPVRYADFDRGIVENAFRPHLLPGPHRADMFATVSQGRVGAFDLEVWNGRRRSVSSVGDNDNVWGGGTASEPVVFPGIAPGPEFVPTSLPHEQMLAANGQPFTVRRNPSVREIPAGSTNPMLRPDGPTAGSVAVEGGGGGYLSNEVAYRATLLRDLLDPGVPGGHLHTPVLAMATGNTTEITDPTFEENRADIAAQTELILRLGAA